MLIELFQANYSYKKIFYKIFIKEHNMKKYIFGVIAVGMLLQLTGCQKKSEATSSTQSDSTQHTKVVVDQLNREVTIPTEISRVAMGGLLPFYSTWYVATGSTKEIVGIHPASYAAAKNSVLADMSPEVLNAKTTFVQNGEVNIEELIKLEPQMFFHGTDKELVEKITAVGIPALAVSTRVSGLEPLATLHSWLNLIGDITNTTERVSTFMEYGTKVQDELQAKLASIPEDKKPRVMFLMGHSEKAIPVAGDDFFSSQWALASGAVNIAKEFVGSKEVNMEQVYSWNPDIIYITNFSQTQPEDLYENKIAGQDWSQLDAVKNKKVYKIPLGIYRWFPPSGDDPLMLKWLAQKQYPDLFTYKMEDEIKTYYKDFYHYDLSDEQITKILHPSSDAGNY